MLQKYSISEIKGFRIIGLQDDQVCWLQGYMVTVSKYEVQSYRDKGFQGKRIARFLASKVTELKSFRITGLQG